MGNSYNQDDNEAEIDKKIKTLQKHLEIAEKEATIAELENKKKRRVKNGPLRSSGNTDFILNITFLHIWETKRLSWELQSTKTKESLTTSIGS